MEKLKSVHVGFLRQVTRKKARREMCSSSRREDPDSVLQEAGTQPLQTYIDRRKMAMAEWMALRPIL